LLTIGFISVGAVAGSLLTHSLGLEREAVRKRERIRVALIAIHGELVSNLEFLEGIEKDLAEKKTTIALFTQPLGSTSSFESAVSSGTFSLFSILLQTVIRSTYVLFGRIETSSQLLYERATELSDEKFQEVLQEVKKIQQQRAAGETDIESPNNPIVNLVLQIQVARPAAINHIKVTMQDIRIELGRS